MATNKDVLEVDIDKSTKNILETLEREREKEIISRRFGLYDRKETLEQIGELLGITRERVRQLEKAILSRLKSQAQEGKLPDLQNVSKVFIKHLHEMGRVATVKDLAKRVTVNGDERDQAKVMFLASLSPDLVVIDESDEFYASVGIAEYGSADDYKRRSKEIEKVIKETGEPVTVEELHAKLSFEHPDHIRALASINKKLAELNGRWGLNKWPLVNPKNIRDKVYVILREKQKPMHFSEIAKEIRKSNFKRKDVTTQAIHNELIKDKRFVLIGRGIYALREWGYKEGTVADIITDVLKKAKKPLHRDEIVREVLKNRQVRETTILLNLQGKPQFKRVAKATYALEEQKK